jgi:hypothetical protein
MMDTSSAPGFSPALMSALKALEPDLAMTPRLFSASSLVMPMPLSMTVMVRAVLSSSTRILNSSRFTPTLSSVSDR